jgi:hypothetical protein
MNDKGVINITVKLVGAAVDEMPLNFYEYSAYVHACTSSSTTRNWKAKNDNAR